MKKLPRQKSIAILDVAAAICHNGGMHRQPDSRSRHVPFRSIYRENFEVVEERSGRTSCYPHTEQLPLLLRALNLEFRGALPDRIARVDRRANGFDKLVLYHAARWFCGIGNRNRADRLRLFELPDADLVFKIAIVQQTSEETPRGIIHRFRFYAGADFFPEIRLSGRRLVFADHVLQRFSARVPNHVGEDQADFLQTFYGHPLISLPCGPGRAFIAPHRDSILAFPYREDDPGEYFIATCLTIKEINSLDLEMPPCAHNFHYAPEYVSPSGRHWLAAERMVRFYDCWRNKSTLSPPAVWNNRKWDRKLGLQMRDLALHWGYQPGSNIAFLDHIPGPHVVLFKAGQKDLLVDELDIYRRGVPDTDWEVAFARRDAILRDSRTPSE